MPRGVFLNSGELALIPGHVFHVEQIAWLKTHAKNELAKYEPIRTGFVLTLRQKSLLGK